jgi:hypothetical protein
MTSLNCFRGIHLFGSFWEIYVIGKIQEACLRKHLQTAPAVGPVYML